MPMGSLVDLSRYSFDGTVYSSAETENGIVPGNIIDAIVDAAMYSEGPAEILMKISQFTELFLSFLII